jgi:hypothetical protein
MAVEAPDVSGLAVPGSQTATGKPGTAPGQATGDEPTREQPADSHSPAQDPPPAAAVNTRWTSTCVRCHDGSPGPGGILCPSCKAEIEEYGDEGTSPGPARYAGRLRRAAHHYLDHGLLPVPAWAAAASGQCCCPRGADCPRPGKHPRAVRTGPGPGEYSWKPLACATHEESTSGSPTTASTLPRT